MARPESLIKLGYFKTPPVIVQALAAWLRAPEHALWRALDPCCGTGEALALLAQHVGGQVETWGVELSPARAPQAAAVLTTVLPTAWEAARVSAEAASLLWLNPPYAPDAQVRRWEIEFLKRSIGNLRIGGVLVYIIPQAILKFTELARLLAGHLKNVTVVRFPDAEYPLFKQVVVLGQRHKYRMPPQEATATYIHMATAALPALDQISPAPYNLPPAPERAHFAARRIPPHAQIAQAYAAGWTPDLRAALHTPPEKRFVRPAHPLKYGHLTMAMAGDLYGTVTLERAGQPVLIRGRVIKTQHTVTAVQDTGSDRVTETTRARDVFTTTIGVLDKDGARLIYEEAGLEAFMAEYGDELAAHILRREPLYNLKPTAAEWAEVSRLGLQRPPLPGCAPGLLDSQKHVALGAARTLRAYGVAAIQGQPGIGKTGIGAAVIALRQAYPALVLCPPHLVEKWLREIPLIIPGAQVRELRRLGKLTHEAHDRNDARAFLEAWRAGALGDKAVAVMAYTAAKDGGGWGPGVALKRHIPDGERGDLRAAFRAAARTYREARLQLPHGPLPPPGKGLPGRGPLPDEDHQQLAALRQAALALTQALPVCPLCGAPQTDKDGALITDPAVFGKQVHTCRCPYPGWALDRQGRRMHAEEGTPVWDWDSTGRTAPLFDLGQGRYRRFPLARYIARHAPGAFKLAIVDEVHEAKSETTDIGYAFYAIARSTPETLVLTGTLFGGKSSSLFYLLYRLGLGTVRAAFPFGDEQRWAEQYGVLETTTTRKLELDAWGKFSPVARGSRRVAEKPGISPLILEQMLYATLFITLPDLGIALPSYAEEVAPLTLPPALREQYDRIGACLQDRCREDRRYLSLWLETLLRRPNSAFRAEDVVKVFRNGKIIADTDTIATLDAVVSGDELLPKEAWLANLVAAERQQGRKVLVYARHTGAWDIQPRLVEVLRARGLHALTLPDTVGTRQRERWLHTRSAGLDVLLVNPEKVKTGLDLIDYATLVFYELTYNLYTLWQAMCRVYRPTQTQPVKVWFPVYTDTLEDEALRLMGAKTAVAKRLYGDEVAGAFVAEGDAADNFLVELAHRHLAGKALPTFRALFADVSTSTASPTGSPVARSPLVVATIAQLWQQVQAGTLDVRPRGRRRPPPVAAGQLPLFS